MNTFLQPLTEDEEKHYLSVLKDVTNQRTERERKQAKEVLIERNLRLVAHIAKKYQHTEEDMEDMISVGVIGLIKAIDSFDGRKGNKLVTYAARCIENELLMLMRSKKKSSREVSLYDSLGMDQDGHEVRLLDIYQKEQKDIGFQIELECVYERLMQCMRIHLEPREFKILALRYGFSGEELTQKEIGVRLNISRSYVSRIEKRALKKLRQAYESKC